MFQQSVNAASERLMDELIEQIAIGLPFGLRPRKQRTDVPQHSLAQIGMHRQLPLASE